MNLQQLYYFQTVSKLKHMTKAAQFHHTSQSTISMAIKKLEQELGVPLMVKNNHGMELTPFGDLFARYVDESLETLQTGITELQQLAKNNENSVRLSTTLSLGSNVLPMILSTFREQHPTIQLKIQQGPNNQIVEQLLRGDCNFVLGRLSSVLNETSLEYYTLLYEDIYLLLPIHHPLATQTAVSLDQLEKESFIMFDQTTGFQQEVLKICESHHFYPNIGYEALDNATVSALVEEGLGIAFVGRMKGINPQKIKRLPIKQTNFQSTICLSWNKTKPLSAGAKILLQFIQEQFPTPLYYPWEYTNL